LFGAFFRSRHHFHDPIRSWDQAGLKSSSPCVASGLVTNEASVRWAQDPNQSPGGKASWADIRGSFLQALTDPAPTTRANAFATTFKLLGQQTHLIGDMAVPAHVRNDIHCFSSDGFELWAARNAALVDAILARDPIKPDPAIFAIALPRVEQEPIARVPIARLWDSDQYSGSNPAVTASNPTIGLAEYSNANFLSDHTVFTPYAFPAQTSVELGAIVVDPKTNELRQYLQKTGDGETVPRVAVVSALFDFVSPALKKVKLGLDDGVFQDYADRLLPRAVGYSSALLDYFFRGRLDVKLRFGVDPDHPDVMQLLGTNTSAEALDNGTLTLYAEDASGNRTPVQHLTSPTSGGVGSTIQPAAPGAAILGSDGNPLQVKATTTPATQYIAVYTGDLGGEKKVGSPVGNPPAFAGAVIGKVLRGPAAEAIFPDGDQRMLRTAGGVFPLPSSAAGLKGVQWGDLDNSFVGFVSNAPDTFTPDRILAFALNRAVGTAQVPLVPGPDTAPVVDTLALKVVDFPYGLDLGTRVNFSHTVQFQELLVTYTTTYVYSNAVMGNTSVTSAAPDVEVVVDQAFTFAANFPIVLDQQHLVGGPSPDRRPYQWQVMEVGLDAQLRLLALVQVNLTQPEDSSRSVTLRSRDSQGALRDIYSVGVEARFPQAVQIWAVIDVEHGTVLGTTAGPTVSLSLAESVAAEIDQRHGVHTGDASGEGWDDAPFVNTQLGYPIVEMGTMTLPPSGIQALTVTGRYAPTIDALVGVPTQVSTETTEPLTIFALD
jgi:hypothetical protein